MFLTFSLVIQNLLINLTYLLHCKCHFAETVNLGQERGPVKVKSNTYIGGSLVHSDMQGKFISISAVRFNIEKNYGNLKKRIKQSKDWKNVKLIFSQCFRPKAMPLCSHDTVPFQFQHILRKCVLNRDMLLRICKHVNM